MKTSKKYFIFGGIVLFIALMLALKPGSIVEPIDSKGFVSYVMVQTASAREIISNDLIKYGALKEVKPLVFSPFEGPLRVDFHMVDKSGSIIVFNAKLQTLVVQEPNLVAGKVIWKCTGYPHSAFPVSCKSGSNNAGSDIVR